MVHQKGEEGGPSIIHEAKKIIMLQGEICTFSMYMIYRLPNLEWWLPLLELDDLDEDGACDLERLADLLCNSATMSPNPGRFSGS